MMAKQNTNEVPRILTLLISYLTLYPFLLQRARHLDARWECFWFLLRMKGSVGSYDLMHPPRFSFSEVATAMKQVGILQEEGLFQRLRVLVFLHTRHAMTPSWESVRILMRNKTSYDSVFSFRSIHSDNEWRYEIHLNSSFYDSY